MAQLISLFGPQQVGKSTTADSMVETLGYTKLSFADPLYAMAAVLADMSVKNLRKIDKEEPREEFEGQTLRRVLQTLGTEWGRDIIGRELWCNTCLRKAEALLDAGDKVVIDDCRFQNEYQGLRGLGAKFIRIVREDMPVEQSDPGHGSEVEWHSFKADGTVVNPSDGVVNWMQLAGKAALATLDVR